MLKTVLLAASITATMASEVALYWGQNSGGNQQNLATYCQANDADIFIISFVTSFPDLALNFANACWDTFSDGLLHCLQIGQDIKTCQSLGKKVLLSLGGASGNYGFSSDAQGQEFADALWNKFGGGSDSERPFDDAVVDGFDFDIENNNPTGYAALAQLLRTKFAGDSSKSYYLSAAPQCPYPDASLGDLLAKQGMDYLFIQFYNNYCSLGSDFNWDTWHNYATSVSPNKNVQLFLGLPGSSSSAGSGYKTPLEVEPYLQTVSALSNFGGVSIWDASLAATNMIEGVSFVQTIRSLLANGNTGTESSASSSTSTTSATSTPTTSTASTTPTTSTTSTTPTTAAIPTPTTSSTTTEIETPISAAETIETPTQISTEPEAVESQIETDSPTSSSVVASEPIPVQNILSTLSSVRPTIPMLTVIAASTVTITVDPLAPSSALATSSTTPVGVRRVRHARMRCN